MAAAVRTVAIVLGVALVLLALLWLFQRRLIYQPDTGAVPPAARVLPGAEDVTLTTSDGLRLGAWYVPATASTSPTRPAPPTSPTPPTSTPSTPPTPSGARDVTVLVANGNGGNRAGRAPLARELSAAGFDVLLFDYRGFADSDGSPHAAGLVRDARAAYRYLAEVRGVPPDRMLYFGESLGSGVVVGLARTHPPAGLLLRSPYESLAAVGQHHYPIVPVRLLLRDDFRVAEQIAGLDVPTTVVYGTADDVIPPEQSRAVAAAAAGPVEVVELPGVNHNDEAMFTGAELIAAVERLAERSVRPSGP